MAEISNISLEIHMKLQKLRQYLQSLGNVAVAFSGGVDSAFLLKVAQEIGRAHV